VLPRFGVTTTYIDGRRIENFEKAILPNTRLIYLESPNSWDFALQDLQAVADLARSEGIITLCDNSYSTPLYQQPVRFGIDLAMQTATKYIGGHSDTLGGILCGSNAMIKKIFDSEYLNIGSGIQPFNAWLLIRGLRTLPARIDRITATTIRMVQYLKKQPKIEEVIFPLDDTFPQFDLARKQMKGACGLVTIVLKAESRRQIVTFCESLRHILMAVSWGGHESLVIPKCASLTEETFEKQNREHRMVRLYFGLEEPQYLINDLDRALSAI
jgi:cystathionine beta-lyase/cystathionine gamma-synthase